MLEILLIPILISGVSLGEETPGYVVLLQGGNSTLQEGVNDSVLTIEDTNPYGVYLTNKSYIASIEDVIPAVNSSIDAAIVRSGKEGNSISIVTVSNPVYSKDTKELTIQVKPLKFYEGAILKNFADEKQGITPDTLSKATLTRVYLEINQIAPENKHPDPRLSPSPNSINYID